METIKSIAIIAIFIVWALILYNQFVTISLKNKRIRMLSEKLQSWQKYFDEMRTDENNGFKRYPPDTYYQTVLDMLDASIKKLEAIRDQHLYKK
jgi:hypothetical protein